MALAVYDPQSVVKIGRKATVVCGVCGDVAKAQHYGGVSCVACKAFFRRAVQSGTYRTFSCDYGGGCTVSKARRMLCRRCRYDKCRKIGMDPSWVKNEDERMLWKLVRQVASRIPKSLSVADEHVTSTDHNCIDRLTNSFKDAVVKTQIPIPPQTWKTTNPKDLHSACILAWHVLRTARFVWQLPEMCRLQKTDAHILFLDSVKQLNLLRVVFGIDSVSKAWPSERAIESRVLTNPIPMNTMSEVMPQKMTEKRLQLAEKLQGMHVDEPCVILLMMIIFFSPERRGLSEPEKVQDIQEQMTLVLKKYVRWRYGGASGPMYAKLLSITADLQEIIDLTDERNFFLHENQVEMFQYLLGDLNPFQSYTIRSSKETISYDMDDLDDVLTMLDEVPTPSTADGPELYDLLENVDDIF